MTLTEIARYRLSNQQIATAGPASPVEAVQWLGAVQAQEYAQTKWGLGLRLPHLNDMDVEKDFTEGKIIRTHLLRPTWHFVAAQDIHWLLALTAPRVHAVNAYMYRKLELDSTVFKRCNEMLMKTLQGHKQLTRDTINEVFQKNKIIAKGHRLSYIMMNAELDGIICSGARQGNRFTYALLDERVPEARSLEKDEALAELTKRYFMSRGPATVKDFSTWSGLTMTDCRRGIGMAGPDLNKEVVEGEEYFFHSGISFTGKPSKSIYLLPIYDEFIMGYKDRSAIFEFRNSLNPKPPVRHDCMIVSDGQVIGTWKRTVKTRSTNVEPDFFRPLNKTQEKAFTTAVKRFETFTLPRT